MRAPLLPGRQANALFCGFANDRHAFLGHIDELVERRNHWAHVAQRTDSENYLNGDIQFALEYVKRGRDNLVALIAWHFLGKPPLEVRSSVSSNRESSLRGRGNQEPAA